MSRGIDSRREVPPPIRHSMIVSERLPVSLVLAPGSLEPFGRWSVPMIRTVSVEVSMFAAGVSAACAESGSVPLSIWALITNSTSESSSQADDRDRQPLEHPARGDPPAASGRRPLDRRRRRGAAARPSRAQPAAVLLAAQPRAQAASGAER